MNKSAFLFLFGALLALHAEPVELTVSAAISLKSPLEELKSKFEKANPGIEILYNFGSSGSLQQQIVNGAPVDVYISAAAKQMNDLERRGLIFPGSRFVLVGNTVELVAPARSETLSGFEELTGDAIRTIAIEEPKTVPAGMYAMEIFEHLGIAERVKDKLVFAKDVRQVMVYVRSGDADAGIVYGSDATASKGVRRVAVAPADSHTKVGYPAALISASANVAPASAFLKFLQSPESSALFKRAGFEINVDD